jgi:hypothetical protein
MSVEAMEGVGPETGGKLFDPLGFAGVSDEALAWFRAAELKHGRVAMIATVGYMLTQAGVYFPGYLSTSEGLTFAQAGADGPLAAWGKVPDSGKAQILFVAGAVEWACETKKPHYTKPGGTPGRLPEYPFDGVEGMFAPRFRFWDPLGFTKALTEEQKARKRLAELKNGRLAMIGIISFFSASTIQGSVPGLPTF